MDPWDDRLGEVQKRLRLAQAELKRLERYPYRVTLRNSVKSRIRRLEALVERLRQKIDGKSWISRD